MSLDPPIADPLVGPEAASPAEGTAIICIMCPPDFS
jgi:hypothetical protein